MSASFYDLLKYAKTGIASPSMTYYDKLRASTLMGGVVKTLTGQPPLSFPSDGTPLISWSMKGNGSQQGTPTPDNPVMPTFCGVRTGNLFDDDNAEFGKCVNSNGTIATNATYAADYDIKVGTASEFSIKHYGDKPYSYSMAFYDSNGDFLSRVHRSRPSDSYDTFPVPENAVSARFQVAVNTSVVMTSAILKAMKLMLNTGSTSLPYEPFGWAEKITCGGQTVPVYLGQTQTVRKIKKLVLTGQETIFYSAEYMRFRVGIADFETFGVRITPFYMSHYIVVSDGRALADVPDNAAYSGSVSDNHYIFIKTTNYTSVDNFKSYLAAQYANGTPVTIWYVLAEPTTGIVNEPLAKIGDYADELHSTDAGVTIPTVKGQNTLTVDTDLQPSEMTITYRG